MQDIYLIRHGTVDCPPGVDYGRLPGFGLSSRGTREAEQAARFLTGRGIRVLYRSPLERCAQTAALIASVINATIVETNDINEWDRSESLKEVRTRMMTFWKMITGKSNESPGVVSHRDPLRALMLALTGGRLADIYKPEVLPLEPGAVWLVKQDEGGAILEKVFTPTV